MLNCRYKPKPANAKAKWWNASLSAARGRAVSVTEPETTVPVDQSKTVARDSNGFSRSKQRAELTRKPYYHGVHDKCQPAYWSGSALFCPSKAVALFGLTSYGFPSLRYAGRRRVTDDTVTFINAAVASPMTQLHALTARAKPNTPWLTQEVRVFSDFRSFVERW